MITEDYVSYEVAKLLKEKGFLKGVDLRITQNLSFYDNIGLCHNLNKYYNTLIKDKIDFVIAPTQQMARKWLREVHYIYADPIKQGNYNDCSEYYTWIVARMGIIHRNSSVTEKLSYKEAEEAAIKYCLENLI